MPLVGALHPSSVGPGSLGNRTLKTNKQDPSYELKILRFSDMNSNFPKNATNFNITLNRDYQFLVDSSTLSKVDHHQDKVWS